VRIHKASGNGHRTITVANVDDRIVQRGLVQTLQPYLDPRFVDNSFGYRPGSGREHGMARAGALARRNDLWTWITQDVGRRGARPFLGLASKSTKRLMVMPAPKPRGSSLARKTGVDSLRGSRSSGLPQTRTEWTVRGET
jgi:hypothetical protein